MSKVPPGGDLYKLPNPDARDPYFPSARMMAWCPTIEIHNGFAGLKESLECGLERGEISVRSDGYTRQYERLSVEYRQVDDATGNIPEQVFTLLRLAVYASDNRETEHAAGVGAVIEGRPGVGDVVRVDIPPKNVTITRTGEAARIEFLIEDDAAGSLTFSVSMIARSLMCFPEEYTRQ